MKSSRFWRFFHNVVAHPLWEILPARVGDWLHDSTAKLAFDEEIAKSTSKEVR